MMTHEGASPSLPGASESHLKAINFPAIGYSIIRSKLEPLNSQHRCHLLFL